MQLVGGPSYMVFSAEISFNSCESEWVRFNMRYANLFQLVLECGFNF